MDCDSGTAHRAFYAHPVEHFNNTTGVVFVHKLVSSQSVLLFRVHALPLERCRSRVAGRGSGGVNNRVRSFKFLPITYFITLFLLSLFES